MLYKSHERNTHETYMWAYAIEAKCLTCAPAKYVIGCIDNCSAPVHCKVSICTSMLLFLNTLRPRQNGRHFADDLFKGIFLKENMWIPIKFSRQFVPKGPVNNIPALVQIMAWRHPGDKPLSEPMIVSLPTHICVTRPQWVIWTSFVNHFRRNINDYACIFIKDGESKMSTNKDHFVSTPVTRWILLYDLHCVFSYAWLVPTGRSY